MFFDIRILMVEMVVITLDLARTHMVEMVELVEITSDMALYLIHSWQPHPP